MADRVNMFLTCRLITLQIRLFFLILRARTKVPKFWGYAAVPLPLDGGVADLGLQETRYFPRVLPY